MDAPLEPSASSTIKDGAVSGVLPEAEAFAVHYPGYPSSTARAVETLGGLPEIAKARSSGSSNLELRFRPEDPYSLPTTGELRPCTALLLRISKFRDEADPTGRETAVALQPAEQLSADVVARVNRAYHFEGMADYQHVVAVHAAESSRRKRRRASGTEPDLEEDDMLDPDVEDVLMLVPKFFSQKNMPENLVLNPSANLFSRNIQKGVVEHRWEMDIEPCLAIAFDIEKNTRGSHSRFNTEAPLASSTLNCMIIGDFRQILDKKPGILLIPTEARIISKLFELLNYSEFIRIPCKISCEENIPKDTAEWEWHMAVSKLFEERPIWPRWSLYERLLDDGIQVTEHQLKRLLFRTGYYFSTGPFGRFWIRKGYDPRKDPESRIFQRVDFRMPPQLRYLVDGNTTSKLKQTWKDICQFRVIPSKIFVCLQLFELVDDFIQQEIRKSTKQTTCTHATGWFSWPMLKTLRLRVSIRFMSIFPKGGVETLLKSTCESFERSKKMEVLSKFWEPEKEHQDANRDSNISAVMPCSETNGSEHEREEEPNNGENEDAEEEDEELDGYESPPVAGEDDTVPVGLNASSYQIRERIPGDYLQELLRGFPYRKDGKDSQPDNGAQGGADLSDGEYQIFGQDSDEDDADDHDDGDGDGFL